MKNAKRAINGIWRRIERRLQIHAPEVFATLSPGASAAELKKLETAIDLKLPADLRQSLTIHNGQNDRTRCLTFCGYASLMPARNIVRDWRMLTKLGVQFDKESGDYSPAKNRLNHDWWRRSCIPFAEFEGDYTCVDMKATKGLRSGRIVEHTHDSLMSETKMPSFTDWLERIARALEAGKFDREVYGYFQVHPDFAWK
jgi:cell wall assembly regulator SMI1